MLLKITRYEDLDGRKLMDVYAESNFENTDYFFPDIKDKEEAVKKVEAGFVDYLKKEFFTQEGSAYWILEEDGVWVSALRTTRFRPDACYLEALETKPDCRKRGYAVRLLTEVLTVLKADGPFVMYDCVGKRNTASLKTHEKCGFQIVSEPGYDYLQEEPDEHTYGLEYRHEGK